MVRVRFTRMAVVMKVVAAMVVKVRFRPESVRVVGMVAAVVMSWARPTGSTMVPFAVLSWSSVPPSVI